MNEIDIKEAYGILQAVCTACDDKLVVAYKEMRSLLERLCRNMMVDENLQMTDLSARISWVSARLGLSIGEQNRLHTFRLTSNNILNHREQPEHDKLLRDAKTLAFFIKKLSKSDIPDELYQLLPKTDATFHAAPLSKKKIEKMRVCYLHHDEQYLYVTPLDVVLDQPLKVCYNIKDVNSEFADTVDILWPHAQLNLLDIAIYDDENILTPSFIVLEPDYLIDISSLAECYKDYGSHPANYLLSRLQPIENALPLLLGNIANLFLDEWIYSKEEPDYMNCMKKAFARYPIELAACAELYTREKEIEFFEACKKHFEHLRKTVTESFSEPGYELDKTDAVLEPSYICEALGLQGRLDYMQRDMSSFIEMKSGKADEYAIRGKVLPKENHKVQMLLYQAVLQYSMGMNHNKVKAFLLYTRYPLLYPSRSSWAMVRRVINLRNRIVANEYSVQFRNNIHYTANLFEQINSDELNERSLSNPLWNRFLRPGIDRFAENLEALTQLERAYFFALYNFVTKELYTSKSGDIDYESKRGAASLWLSTLMDKLDGGEILHDLSIIENNATDEHKANIIFSLPESSLSVTLPNFRLGDAIVLYQRNDESDNVTNKMVFKGNIEELNSSSIKIRLRATQHNISVLPSDSLYAIEHDSMDTSYRSMFMSLAAFINANRDRKELLLMQRPPLFDDSYQQAIQNASDDFERVALKAQAAKDFFLLVGPPGTGKTSRALKLMVEKFYSDDQAQILILSYTNRAVDEICKSLSSISPSIDYIRIGSELSCDPLYRDHLIENELAKCSRRTDVINRINECRVIVSTVASISGKPEIFRMKKFEVAIIDESSQILEPQLLGILCAQTPQGDNAIDKFIMIGDHKQLPAVVLQNADYSEVYDDDLRNIGLINLRNSLFERLYYKLREDNNELYESACDMLRKQGRMHPDVAYFSNKAFYAGQLLPVGLPHQLEHSDDRIRVSFYPSEAEPIGGSVKVNKSEALIVSKLVKDIYDSYLLNNLVFDSATTLGVITPYRSQIALIKREIESLGIEALNNIIVDTVERFQGSERDIIIYSFCVNTSYQLKQLSNITVEDGVSIDRKLNVALTRARKQMIITGVQQLLVTHPIYKKLVNWLTEK